MALASVALVVWTTGCAGSSGGTKAGGRVERHITLVMQTPDAPDVDAAYFIRQVWKRTEGRIEIAEGAADYRSDEPDNEARLVRALRDGREEMAYIPSRAWERASEVRSFRALQAPFLVTDYSVLREIATGSVARSMLQSLGRIDIVGLGLVPNELRRPLARTPLLSLAAFRGARIRVITSPTSVLALRARRNPRNHTHHESARGRHDFAGCVSWLATLVPNWRRANARKPAWSVDENPPRHAEVVA